ncbi:MAG: 30S ribosomal protein S20 [bacterium]|nr:30S ribosomal protein S20 [bacterium]
MPITQSAKKALRQNKKRNLKNNAAKLALKLAVKEFKRLLVIEKSGAEKYLAELMSRIDKSVNAKVIKKNKASRMKSRLSRKLSS